MGIYWIDLPWLFFYSGGETLGTILRQTTQRDKEYKLS